MILRIWWTRDLFIIRLVGKMSKIVIIFLGVFSVLIHNAKARENITVPYIEKSQNHLKQCLRSDDKLFCVNSVSNDCPYDRKEPCAHFSRNVWDEFNNQVFDYLQAVSKNKNNILEMKSAWVAYTKSLCAYEQDILPNDWIPANKSYVQALCYSQMSEKWGETLVNYMKSFER